MEPTAYSSTIRPENSWIWEQIVLTNRGRRGGKCVPTAAEDGARAVAIPRAADRPTGPRDGQPAQSAPGRGRAVGGSARSGSGLGATDHCRSWSHRSDLSL